MKIKTFEFWVSNSQTTYVGTRNYRPDYANPAITEQCEIDTIINSFLSTCANVLDIRVHDTTINRHNNGYDDTIRRTYTIIYK